MFLLFDLVFQRTNKYHVLLNFTKKKIEKDNFMRRKKISDIATWNIVNIQKDKVLLIIFSNRFNSDLYAYFIFWSNYLELMQLKKIVDLLMRNVHTSRVLDLQEQRNSLIFADADNFPIDYFDFGLSFNK